MTSKVRDIMYVPRAECPMIPVHWVGKIAGFSTCQFVVQETLGFESKSIVLGGAQLSTLNLTGSL